MVKAVRTPISKMMVAHTKTTVHVFASMSQTKARTSGTPMAQSSSTHHARTRSPNQRPAMDRDVLMRSKSWLVCAGAVVTPVLNVCASTHAGSLADEMVVGNTHCDDAALVVLYTGTQRKNVDDVAMGVTQHDACDRGEGRGGAGGKVGTSKSAAVGQAACCAPAATRRPHRRRRAKRGVEPRRARVEAREHGGLAARGRIVIADDGQRARARRHADAVEGVRQRRRRRQVEEKVALQARVRNQRRRRARALAARRASVVGAVHCAREGRIAGAGAPLRAAPRRCEEQSPAAGARAHRAAPGCRKCTRGRRWRSCLRCD